MKKLFAVMFIALGMGAVPLATGACGSGGDSSTGSGDTSGSNTTTGGSTTSGQSCNSTHACINGSCNCGPIDMNGMGTGKSCTDDTKCEAECKVCM